MYSPILSLQVRIWGHLTQPGDEHHLEFQPQTSIYLKEINGMRREVSTVWNEAPQASRKGYLVFCLQGPESRGRTRPLAGQTCLV